MGRARCGLAAQERSSRGQVARISPLVTVKAGREAEARDNPEFITSIVKGQISDSKGLPMPLGGAKNSRRSLERHYRLVQDVSTSLPRCSIASIP